MQVGAGVAVSAAALVAAIAAIRGAGAGQTPAGEFLPVHGYTIVRTYPHDRDAFTQGLQYVDGFLYEGTGMNGRSSIRKVRLDTGEVVQRRDIAQEYFGEGIVIVGGELFQLTWQSGIGFVYDRATFTPKRTFRYRGEGWGLTYDGSSIVMSDGTDALRFLDPKTLAERSRLRVTAGGKPLPQLNELEFVDGEILANVWMTDYIARIDPKSGRVRGWIDLRGLLSPRERAATDVLNGIAYDAAGKRLFVTGKLWPRVFEIAVKK